jgi:hypothetical protein
MLRAAIVVSLAALLAVSGAALAQDDVRSTANFYAREGECRFEFAVAWRDHAKTLKGSLAWVDGDLQLRLPDEAFVVAGDKLAKDADDMFGALLLHKKLAVGLWQSGAIVPIEWTGLDPRPFVDCVMRRARSVKRAVAR